MRGSGIQEEPGLIQIHPRGLKWAWWQWAGREKADFRATDSGSAVSPQKDGVGTLFPDLRLVESTSPYPGS